MKRTDHYITNRQAQKLKQISVETGLSVSELIRRAIDVWLEKK